MQPAIKPLHTAETTPVAWNWMAVSLLSHSLWGFYPVLARYLQIAAGVPSMAILTISGIIALAIIGTIVLWRGELRTLRAPIVWAVAVLAMLRSVTNVLGARYAPAVYVQLINLMTPFLIAGLSTLWLRQRLPRGTIPALLVSSLGAVAMLSGNLAESGQLMSAGGGTVWLGLGLSGLSSLALALYMLAVRRTAAHNVSGEGTFAVQLAVLILSSAVLSLLFGEDWTRLGSVNIAGWSALLAFALGMIFGANITQIHALRRLGAPLVSSMQAWRLIATLVAGGMILHEWLTTPVQISGAFLVVLTISWYLWNQRRAARRHG